MNKIEKTLEKAALNYRLSTNNKMSIEETAFKEGSKWQAKITEQIAIEFLEFVENNYYYNSSCWVNCETDKVESRKDIFQEFLKQRK